jgi:hypothetical protein
MRADSVLDSRVASRAMIAVNTNASKTETTTRWRVFKGMRLFAGLV